MPEKKTVAVYGLASRRTRTIGVIVHGLDSHLIASALSGIEQMTAEWGYEVIITQLPEKREAFDAGKLFNGNVAGVLVSQSAGAVCRTHAGSFRTSRIPMVFFDCAENIQRTDSVVIDNRRCGFIATEHLIRQGCARIALVTSDLGKNVSKRRYEGYRDALEAYGLSFSEELFIDAGLDVDGGIAAAHGILKMRQLPDGLFITSDLAAAGCMQALTDRGISVPEDIAIVGFNNDPVGRLVTPALTTVDHPGLEVGRIAASKLLSRLAGNRKGEGRTAVIPSNLIIRASSLRRGISSGLPL